MKKRPSIVAAALCLALCLGLFPTAALAETQYRNLKIIKQLASVAGADEVLVDTSAFLEIRFELRSTADIIDMSDGSIITKRGEVAKLYDPNTRKYMIPAEGIRLNNDGTITLKNVPFGKYTLNETTVPAGIATPAGVPVQISYDDAMDGVSATITNDLIVASFSNTDVSGESLVAGSTLAIYKEDGTLFTKKNSSPLAWTSSAKAYVIAGLPAGNYLLRQSAAADGYVLRTSDVPFTVADSKVTQKFAMPNKQVILDKAAVAGEKPTGATITIKDEKTGVVVDTWVYDGTEHAICNLVEGRSYIVSETPPANGNVVFRNMEFKVNSDYSENQNILWNPSAQTPATGDATNIALLCFGLMIGAAGIVLLKKRREA